MPTDSFSEQLDRDIAKAEARALIDATCPLLRELVNYATWACVRCMRAPDDDRRGDENESVAPLTLYQQLIEQTDAIEVLLSESCVNGAVPVLRSAFETVLSLEYILSSDAHFQERTLAWVCCYLHRRIQKHEELDARTPRGGARLKVMEEFFGHSIPAYDSTAGVQGLQCVLARPQFQEIEADYQKRLAKNHGRIPEWFSLLGGPRNRRFLASFLNHEPEYLALYGEWSDIAHATDASVYLAGAGDKPKQVAFRPLRFAAALPQRAFLAASFMIRGTRLILGHYRPGEPGLKAWYRREIQEPFRRLQELQVKVV